MAQQHILFFLLVIQIEENKIYDRNYNTICPWTIAQLCRASNRTKQGKSWQI